MNLPNFVVQATKTAKSNAPEILTALGVSGVITTSYLTGKAAYEASKIIEQNEASGYLTDRKERIKERAQHTWRLYVPAVISGTLTVVCIVGASRASGKRTAAAVTAYSLTERAFSEYREKVVEQIGKGKEQKIRDEIAQEQVEKTQPKSREVLVIGSGTVLCCELYTNRFFRSDMETLRKAMNDINGLIVKDVYVTLDEFYDTIGLPHTTNSGNVGWDFDKLLDLKFSTVLANGGEPCLAFDYNYVKPLK